MKSHFQFTRKQRSGIFLLLLLIVLFQLGYVLIDFSSENVPVDQKQLDQFQAEIDSLKLIKQDASQPKLYPFNPNYITDYKGYVLGMTTIEIDRLHQFRSTNQWVNSAEDFQSVTQVSDSLLNVISPYFKFPEWVTSPKSTDKTVFSKTVVQKTFQQKADLNTATADELRAVNGIGAKLSQRIVDYRRKNGGSFVADVQLKEVYGLSPEVIARVLEQFTVKSGATIKTINLNTATIDQLVTIKYIDYEIAHHIVEARILREGFSSIDDLKKVKDFPLDKIEIIRLYLTID